MSTNKDDKKLTDMFEDDHKPNGGRKNGADEGKSVPKSKSENLSSKYHKLKKQFEEMQQELEDLKAKMLRNAADFENYKKRSEKEFLNVIANANAELIADILPIVDDLERFQKSTTKDKEAQDVDSLLRGIELIHKNLMKAMEKRGVKAIESVGHEFDPEKHDALMQVESDEHEPGLVVEEHLKGYEMNGRVLRHAQVLVSK